MSYLMGKDFKEVIINMFNEIKEVMIKEVKHSDNVASNREYQ